MTKRGHVDIVLSNEAPDPKLVLVNEGTFDAHPFGDGTGAIYGMFAADLDEGGRLDSAVARSGAQSFIPFSRPSK